MKSIFATVRLVCQFDIRTGAVVGPPAPQAVKSYPVRVTGADVEIEV